MRIIAFVILLIAVAGCTRQPPTAAAPEAKRPQWEYKVIEENSLARAGMDALMLEKNGLKDRDRRIGLASIPGGFVDVTEKLNELGKDGWELVATLTEMETVFPDMSETGYPKTDFQSNTRTGKELFILKRQKQ